MLAFSEVVIYSYLSKNPKVASFPVYKISCRISKSSIQKHFFQTTQSTKTHKIFPMYTLSNIDSFCAPLPDTYIYDIIPVLGGIAVISSDDAFRLLDPLTLSGQPITSLKDVNKDITCMKAFSFNGFEGSAEVVCTGGRDGRLVLLDPRSGGMAGEVRSGELFLVSF